MEAPTGYGWLSHGCRTWMARVCLEKLEIGRHGDEHL